MERLGGAVARRAAVAVVTLVQASALIATGTTAVAEPPSVLMVVASPGALTSGDTAVRSRLIGNGFAVVIADDASVSAAEATDHVFTLVTSSVDSAVLGARLLSVTAPLWLAKPYLFDDYRMTGPQAGVDYDSKKTNVVTITSMGHPLAAGREGDVTIQAGNNRVSWGRPAASAAVVATVGGSDATIFTIAAGATLVGGQPAAGCRLTLPLFNNAPASFTADGWALFDSAASWAAGGCGSADNPPTVAFSAPPGNGTVSGTTPVTATATDDHGVTSVGFAVDGSSIGTDSSGADGWSVSWDTTAVPDGPHTLLATATDSGGQTGTATRQVNVVNAAEPAVVFVVANPGALSTGETAVRQRLQSTGFNVVLADDAQVTAADAESSAFVLISSSVDSRVLGNRLYNVSRPLLIAKPYLFDDYQLTGPQAGVDYESKSATSVTIAAPGHSLAAGRTGTVAVQAAGTRVSWGRPGTSATIVATAGTDATVFTIAAGAALVGGQVAAGCRMTFPLFNNAPAAFTTDGWAMFDAAARWAAADCSAPPPPPTGDVEHVVFVSIDGFNPQSISALGPDGAPTFHGLPLEGVSTLNARTTVEETRTLPNHSSMVTGRKVTTPGGHGVTFNDDNGSTIHTSAGGYVASIFDAVHDNGGSTALYAGKSKFDFIDRSWNAVNGAADVTGSDNGRDKIDFYQLSGSATNLSTLLTRLASPTPTTLSMVHFADPDNAGHASGFMSAEYLQAVSRVDGYVGQIIDAVTTDPDLSGRTVIIVSTDHGGSGFEHSDPTAVANYTVPYYVWGAGVTAGADLYALNPDRLDPGTDQPPYTAAVPPIRTGEIANLAADLLDLPVVPGSTFNADLSLSVRSGGP